MPFSPGANQAGPCSVFASGDSQRAELEIICKKSFPNEQGPNEQGPNEQGPNEQGPNEQGPNEQGPNEQGMKLVK